MCSLTMILGTILNASERIPDFVPLKLHFNPLSIFSCDNGEMISLLGRCDGLSDCGDLSDEQNCTNSTSMYFLHILLIRTLRPPHIPFHNCKTWVYMVYLYNIFSSRKAKGSHVELVVQQWSVVRP